MRLTSFTDYSLRALIYLANAPDGRATIAEIAHAFGISEDHVVKVVHRLGRAGVLRNRRGRGGGVQLARPPGEINVAALVRLTEGRAVLAECFDPETNRCALAGGCGLHAVLREALAAFYAVLERHSVADLRVGRRELAKLKRVPYLPGNR